MRYGFFAGGIFALGILVLPLPCTAGEFPADANTTCPVMPDEESDPDIYVEHQGEKVYLCCTKCKREFKKEPAKYLEQVRKAKASRKRGAALPGAKDLQTTSSN